MLMDSINLPDAQSTPLNCRNTASNTSPIACACCGSKDYVQTLSHANYFRMLYPGTPRCKHPHDNCEENCALQPFFPSLPYLPPFFHNAIPPNVYCSHTHFDDSSNLKHLPEENRLRTDSEKKVPHAEQKENRDFRQSKAPHDSNQKNPPPLGPDFQFSAYPFLIPNVMDPQFNPYLQRCACGDSSPWTCSPFIIPMISYCVLWNSQKYSSILPPHFAGSQQEMLFQQHDAPQQNRKSSSDRISQEKADTGLHTIKQEDPGRSKENKNSSSEESLGDAKLSQSEWKLNDESSVNSSSLMTAPSLKFAEEDGYNNSEKKYLENDSNGGRTEEDVMEVEGFIEDQVESEVSLKVDGKTSNSKVHLLISLDSNDYYTKGDGSRTQLTTEGKEHSADCAELLEVSDTGEKAFLSLKRSFRKIQDSDEDSRKITSQSKATVHKGRMSFTKFIKNFTITDQAPGGPHEAAHSPSAAAGDLGGEHCVGYRVLIPPCDKDQERQEGQAEGNLEPKSSSEESDGLVFLNDKKSDSPLDKSTDGLNRLKGKGKPSSSSKGRESNEKKSGDESKEDPSAVKRKHSCYTADGATGNVENSSKIHKMKNYVLSQQQSLGKLQTNVKNQQIKREERVASTKTKLQNPQKQSSAFIKNRRK